MDGKDMIKYYVPVVLNGPGFAIINHHMTCRKIAALTCMHEMAKRQLQEMKELCIKKELEKPFIIVYWKCFGRVV